MLFQPFTLKSLTLKNRIVMPPMCMYSAQLNGMANDWHFLHYTTRAIGGVGLIIQEATGVEPGGRITARDLGLWDDGQGERLKPLVEAVHRHGAQMAVQLIHAGRKSEVETSRPVGPSPIAFSDKYREPRALTKSEIAAITDNFAAAARRAVAAGYDAVEIHAAHGYLLNQFISPLANQRDDEYGGSPAGRVRFLGEVVAAVRAVLPSTTPLFVRVSASDWEEGGCTPETTAEMLNIVKDRGIDLVHVSSGAVTPAVPPAYPGYQIPFALTVKAGTGLPVIGGGLVTQAVQAQQIIKAGVDLVFLGRQLLRSPYWPLEAAYLLGQQTEWPPQYTRARFI